MTTGKTEKLVRMANQIGEFYATMPEKEATEGAARHLKRYWTPKMIREIVAVRRGGERRSQSDRGARRRGAQERRSSVTPFSHAALATA